MKRFVLPVGVTLTILIVSLGSIYFLDKSPKVSVQLPKLPNVSQKPASPYQSIKGTYLFSGTIMLGRAIEKYANGNTYQPFSGVDTLGSYDARIGVLECPITNNSDSYQNQVANLIFNCNPNFYRP